MSDSTLAAYRVVVSRDGGTGDGAPIRACTDQDALDQARTTASAMPSGVSFQVLCPDGTLLREFSR